MVPCLTTGLKVSSESKPGSCVKPRATSRVLYRSIEPSNRVLILNTHLLLTRFMPGRWGTKVHVLLLERAVISACMACCHFGSVRACLYVWGACGWFAKSASKHAGIGYLEEKKALGFNEPVWAHVIIGWLRRGAECEMISIGREDNSGASWLTVLGGGS